MPTKTRTLWEQEKIQVILDDVDLFLGQLPRKCKLGAICREGVLLLDIKSAQELLTQLQKAIEMYNEKENLFNSAPNYYHIN